MANARKFYFDPTRGLDVIESLVEYMLEEGYLPKNASGRVEIGDKKYTKIADRRDVSGEATG